MSGDQESRAQRRITGIVHERPRLIVDPADSAEGCRKRAEADLLKAAEDMPVAARRILEASARSWLARAELLQRLEKSLAARSSDGPEGD